MEEKLCRKFVCIASLMMVLHLLVLLPNVEAASQLTPEDEVVQMQSKQFVSLKMTSQHLESI